MWSSYSVFKVSIVGWCTQACSRLPKSFHSVINEFLQQGRSHRLQCVFQLGIVFGFGCSLWHCPQNVIIQCSQRDRVNLEVSHQLILPWWLMKLLQFNCSHSSFVPCAIWATAPFWWKMKPFHSDYSQSSTSFGNIFSRYYATFIFAFSFTKCRWYTAFLFCGWLLKTWWVKTMGTCGTINAVSLNIS